MMAAQQSLGAYYNVHITIVGGEYHQPDTSSMLVFYATVQVLCSAYAKPCVLTIDAEGDFIIPKYDDVVK